MKVRVVVQMSGTRDGEDWPQPGGVVDLPKVEAERYIRGGLVARVDDAPVEAAVAREPETATVSTAPRKRRTAPARLDPKK